jgi:CDP-glycerol glycerophosphotransferase (TagB/SpsB family)
VVAVSFHWDCQVAQETRSSFIFFRSGLALSKNYKLIGHGHPRMFDRLKPWYDRKGIETERSFTEVLKKADLYVCDNSSSLFEFAATGRPVVVMNPPFYRRGIRHGLRFWDAADVGLSLERPSDFNTVVLRALKDPAQSKVNRAAALDLVYSHRDGTSAERAASALVDWVTTR